LAMHGGPACALARRLGLAAVLSLLVMAAVAVPAGARTTRQTCTSRGSGTVLQNDSIRVFRTPQRRLGGVHVDGVYACWRSSGRRTRLVRESSDGDGSLQFDSVAQPGAYGSPIIAFTTTLITRSGGTDSIVSMNVRTGRVVHRNAGDVRAYELAESGLAIDSFLVTPAGSLAWIGQGDCSGSTDAANDGITGVYAIDASRRERAVQCGVAGGDLGSGSGPAEFAGLRYVVDDAQLSWLSRTGLETATLH
jgi:hypothetical protein